MKKKSTDIEVTKDKEVEEEEEEEADTDDDSNDTNDNSLVDADVPVATTHKHFKSYRQKKIYQDVIFAMVNGSILCICFVALQTWLSYGVDECPSPPS